MPVTVVIFVANCYDSYDDCNFPNKIIYLSKSYEAEEGQHRTGHILQISGKVIGKQNSKKNLGWVLS